MAYGRKCPHCGAYLDPGEWCDCAGHELPEIEMAQRPRRDAGQAVENSTLDAEFRRIYRRWLEQ